jgi:hypothetical protein
MLVVLSWHYVEVYRSKVLTLLKSSVVCASRMLKVCSRLGNLANIVSGST